MVSEKVSQDRQGAVRKTLVSLAVSLTLVFSVFLGACSTVEHVVAQVIQGDVTGEIGKEYTTAWFTFTINSSTRTSEYAGYTAPSGYELIVADITEKNISSDSQLFGAGDWYLSHSTFKEELYPLEAFDSKMMPEEFRLSPNQEVRYTCVFEVSKGLSDLHLTYTEINTNNEVFATFKIKV